MHGSEPDTAMGVTHFGARHMAMRGDGMWLQREPLLASANLIPGAAHPLAFGQVYSAGNTNLYADPDGEFIQAAAVLAAAEVLGTAMDVTTVVYTGYEYTQGEASGGDVAMAVGGATAGVVLPGAGLAVASRVGKSTRVAAMVENVASAFGRSGRCFVEGTEVPAVESALAIESIGVGDRVLSYGPAASTDGGEKAWVKVESDASVKSAAWSTRGRPSGGVCSRIAKAGRTAVLPAMLAACAPASAAVELPSDVAVVQVYDARTGAWERGTVGDSKRRAPLEVGDEVLHDGHLLRVTEEGVEDRGFAEVGQLSEADATWTVDGVRSVPDGDDWVLVLGDADDAGHWRLQDLAVGERFAFGGRVFESDVVDGDLAVRATGDVLGRVYETHVRKSDVVIDLVVSGPDGDETITGTPEHPFWVEAVGDYVAMGDLEVGTVLRTTGGGEARVAATEWREGDFEVFNFEVEGVHNYFVSAPGGVDAGVLVHNGCGPDVGDVVEMGPGMRSIPELDVPGGPKSGSAGGPGAGKGFGDDVKDQARDQAGGRCVFCGEGTTVERGRRQGQTDHSIPRSRDGNDTLENAQHTCADCNVRKGTQTTEEFLGQ